MLLLLLTLLLKIPAAAPPAARVTFSPLTKAAYEQAKKTAIVTKPTLTFPVKKARGRIVIPTSKGPRIFQDKGVGTDNDDQAQYEYQGYAASLKMHLVDGRYWEGGEWLLVSDTGQQLALPSPPEYSPDTRSFVAFSAGIEVSFMLNVIQLYRLENGRWRQVWKLEPSVEPATWEPAEIHWLSNSTLLLKKRMWTGKNSGNTFTYAKLSLQ
ncbi:hypothetical protein ACFST9_23735 [Hymenobacter monticola]|uniref:Uncharacterized protein n=1 Tax=Hymenobacter monticola TaxID=1705399 RepID=A0ABY4B6F3_9BACT|nr:hypothetical protein [Hymenobacter monticola]UOE33887.1 hypothetical protein MTP16_22585 [Hymenobacter monticola]